MEGVAGLGVHLSFCVQWSSLGRRHGPWRASVLARAENGRGRLCAWHTKLRRGPGCLPHWVILSSWHVDGQSDVCQFPAEPGTALANVRVIVGVETSFVVRADA
jgi:hypothetical protein